MIVLRPKQQELKNAIYNDWNNNIKNTLAVSPTGGGKSVICSDIILDGARSNMQQAVIAHRNELVAQMSEHVADRGIPHRIIAADKTISNIRKNHREKYNQCFINPSAKTAVIGVDTLIARQSTLNSWAYQTDRWIIDEAHHVLRANKWGKAVEMFPNALGLGVTATPHRADGHGLGRHAAGVFDNMVIGAQMRELIEDGHLCDFQFVCPVSDLVIDDQKVSKDGDWSHVKLKAAAKKSRIVGDVLSAYIRYAYYKQSIVFATDIETSCEIAADFNAAGISTVALSSKTNATVRDKYIKEFRQGKIRVLINVDLFDEGFDVPACEVVIMARPTASLGKYRQMCGRCLRTADGKEFGLIIDLVSNFIRHKAPDLYIPWSLDNREKRGRKEKDPDEIEYTVCKNKHCARPYEKYRCSCPHCGFTPPLPEPQKRTIDQVQGDLILLDAEALKKMREAAEIEAPADVAARVKHVAGEFAARGVMNKQLEKIEERDRLEQTIDQWAGYERAKGLTDREIQRRFYGLMGTDVVSVMNAKQTRKDFQKLADTVERWYL